MFVGLWVLVVVAAVAATWAVQQRGAREDEALAILDRRLAAGELSVDEHAQRRQVLLEGDRRRTTPWWGLVLVLVLIGLVVLALASSMWWMGGVGWGPRGGGWMSRHMGWDGSTGSTSAAVEGARTIDVTAGDLWFEPDTIEVTAGQPVNLVLDNTGDVFHDLTVPAANFVVATDPGEQATGGLELRDGGRVEFFCSVPGHAEEGMRGTVVVSASTDS